MTNNRICLLALLVPVLSCGNDIGIKPVYELKQVLCHPTECDRIFYIEMASLETCYGDKETWTSPPVPQELLDAGCQNENDDCFVTVKEDVEIETERKCTCRDSFAQPEPPDECCEPATPLEANEAGINKWDEAGEDLLNRIDARCSLELGAGISDASECDEPAHGVLEEWVEDSQCPDPTNPTLPASDVHLTLEREASYLFLSTATDQCTSPMTGSGSLRHTSDPFLRTVLQTEDAELDGVLYEDWQFWLDTPLDVTAGSGDFALLGGQTFGLLGVGQAGSQEMGMELALPEGITGELQADSQRWSLDFSSPGQLLSPTVHMHLEGSYEVTP